MRIPVSKGAPHQVHAIPIHHIVLEFTIAGGFKGDAVTVIRAFVLSDYAVTGVLKVDAITVVIVRT